MNTNSKSKKLLSPSCMFAIALALVAQPAYAAKKNNKTVTATQTVSDTEGKEYPCGYLENKKGVGKWVPIKIKYKEKDGETVAKVKSIPKKKQKKTHKLLCKELNTENFEVANSFDALPDLSTLFSKNSTGVSGLDLAALNAVPTIKEIVDGCEDESALTKFFNQRTLNNLGNNTCSEDDAEDFANGGPTMHTFRNVIEGLDHLIAGESMNSLCYLGKAPDSAATSVAEQSIKGVPKITTTNVFKAIPGKEKFIAVNFVGDDLESANSEGPEKLYIHIPKLDPNYTYQANIYECGDSDPQESPGGEGPGQDGPGGEGPGQDGPGGEGPGQDGPGGDGPPAPIVSEGSSDTPSFVEKVSLTEHQLTLLTSDSFGHGTFNGEIVAEIKKNGDDFEFTGAVVTAGKFESKDKSETFSSLIAKNADGRLSLRHADSFSINFGEGPDVAEAVKFGSKAAIEANMIVGDGDYKNGAIDKMAFKHQLTITGDNQEQPPVLFGASTWDSEQGRYVADPESELKDEIENEELKDDPNANPISHAPEFTCSELEEMTNVVVEIDLTNEAWAAVEQECESGGQDEEENSRPFDSCEESLIEKEQTFFSSCEYQPIDEENDEV